MTCEHCRQYTKRLIIHGNELWCQRCQDGERGDVNRATAVIGDDIPGGFVQEHFGNQPEVFYSKKAMAARAKELGLVPFVRWSGENDRHVTRWSAPDQYTLDAAAALVGRMK